MLRVCDQVGYVSMVNNKRTIQFDPTDLTIGKNTANLPIIQIPDESDPALATFMEDIIAKTKSAMVRSSKAQIEAMDKTERYRKEIAGAKDVDDLNNLIPPVQEMPKALKDQLNKLIGDKAKENKWTWNKTSKVFEAPAPPLVSDNLKKEIPGESITDVKEPELSFN